MYCLHQLPTSRLGKLAFSCTHESIISLCDHYSIINNEFFFDRHPHSFKTILNFYRTGKLHVIDQICVIAFSDDLRYWNIDEIWLENCCQHKYNTRKETVEEEMKKEAANMKNEECEYWGEGRCGRYQQFLWDLLEKPHTSLGAKVMSILSLLFVVISTIAMVINTLPEFAGPEDALGRQTDNPILAKLETICITWFTLEYILRFAGQSQTCA